MLLVEEQGPEQWRDRGEDLPEEEGVKDGKKGKKERKGIRRRKELSKLMVMIRSQVTILGRDWPNLFPKAITQTLSRSGSEVLFFNIYRSQSND